MQNNKFDSIDILADIELSINNSNSNILENESTTLDTQTISNDLLSLDIENLPNISFENENNLELENISTLNLKEEINISENNNDDILENISIQKVEKKEKKNSIFSGIIFLTKYILTSSLIFSVLLVSTNYSAYINIAKSYIYEGEMQIAEKKLIASVDASYLVNASDIKDKYSKEGKEDLENEKKESKKLSIQKMKKEQDKKDINLNIEITPYKNRIIIPKIGKNIPLVDIKNRNIKGEEELNNIFMDELENGVIRYPGSAKPGEDGTSFIFGHSSNFPWVKGDFNDVFALLDKVEFNDEIIIYYGQEKYTYKIREKKVITPGDVSVLERNKKKSEITLMTCWPIGTTLNRLIVVGELVKG